MATIQKRPAVARYGIEDFNFKILAFLIPLEVQGHTVPYLKGLRYGKDESKGLNCGCTSVICQDVMKSDNLLHKQGFVDSQMVANVERKKQLLGFLFGLDLF